MVCVCCFLSGFSTCAGFPVQGSLVELVKAFDSSQSKLANCLFSGRETRYTTAGFGGVCDMI